MTNIRHSVSGFWDKNEHRRILMLTLPMILANVTTPLIGLVDTAVLGHMQGTHFLAGAAIGTLIITQIYWVCGFIRMSVTGLSAQAKGKDDPLASAKSLFQSMGLAFAIGILMVVLQGPLLHIGVLLTEPDPLVKSALTDYFSIRIYGAPAALINLAVIGWLIGQQRARAVMWIQVGANLLNVVLNILFVFGFGWEIKGVALASILAEFAICALGTYLSLSILKNKHISRKWFRWAALKSLMNTNRDMLIRNLSLQFCLAFITVQGARMGATTAATNAILMQFFVLIALGLDGIAHAVEALVGEQKGKMNKRDLGLVVKRGLFWSSAFALVYALLFGFFDRQIVALLTHQTALHLVLEEYALIIVLIPIIAHWCFLYDGVFVGLTRSQAMRNSMVISALMVFIPVWWLFADQGNMGLWYGMLAFLAARGITLGAYFSFLGRHEGSYY